MVEERTNVWRQFFIFVAVGAATGVVLLHPVAMFITDYQAPPRQFNWRVMQMVFSIEHFPMTVFFTLLGLFIGIIYGIFNARLKISARRLRLLEGILPICCVCKKIRDKESVQPKSAEWMTVEDYISAKTDARFSHGYCPDCYEQAMKKIDKLKDAKPIGGS